MVGAGDSRSSAKRRKPIYLALPSATVAFLQDLPGTDDARINFLAAQPGVKLVGREGLPEAAQQLLQAILDHRAAHPTPPSSDPHHLIAANRLRLQQPASGGPSTSGAALTAADSALGA